MRSWLALALVACAPPSSARWVQSADVRWDLLNHRISALTVRPDPLGVAYRFTGGASTTGVRLDAGGTCDVDDCAELPFLDTSTVTARVVDGVGTSVALGTARVRLEDVDRAGASASVLVAMPAAARGEVTAWIAGFALSTDTPIGPEGAGCYDTGHGWLPTRLRVAVVDAAEERDGVRVTVEAAFASGLSLESIRACLDAAAPGARVVMDVDLVVAQGATPARGEVEVTQSFPRDPGGTQPPPSLGDAQAWAGAEASGWASLDWTFHDADVDGRGAYLRGLGWTVTADAAGGYASNSSATMLSGFDYRFVGALVAVPGLDLRVTDVAAQGVSAATDVTVTDGAGADTTGAR
ncbi:MAG: hypothetical protein RLZZ383_1836 [Pseudomonadota bacterium]|jgi:hypothetical protein